MPSFLVHQAAMSKTIDVMKKYKMPVYFEKGNILDQMEADRGLSHGYVVQSNVGSTPSRIEESYRALVKGIKTKTISEINKHARRLSHYITDALSIGQIEGPVLWGKKDDMLDFMSEFVINKKKADFRMVRKNDYESCMTYLLNKIEETHKLYLDSTLEMFNKFPFVPTPPKVTPMIRRAVSLGANITANFLQAAFSEAVKGKGDKNARN